MKMKTIDNEKKWNVKIINKKILFNLNFVIKSIAIYINVVATVCDWSTANTTTTTLFLDSWLSPIKKLNKMRHSIKS
jgi:hypothetical protein